MGSPFYNVKEIVDAQLQGRTRQGTFRKSPSFLSTQGQWADLSMAAGEPKANYYASPALIAENLDGWAGLFHGDDLSPQELYISEISVLCAASNIQCKLLACDYLLYYPYLDLDSVDVQTLVQAKAIQRYTDGVGNKAIIVGQSGGEGGGSFVFNYINQDGVERTSPQNFFTVAAGKLGQLLTSAVGNDESSCCSPWMQIQPEDSGIRAVTSLECLSPTGGVAAIVILHPIADQLSVEYNLQAETTYCKNRVGLPRVYDGAHLNFLAQTPVANWTGGRMVGRVSYVWTE